MNGSARSIGVGGMIVRLVLVVAAVWFSIDFVRESSLFADEAGNAEFSSLLGDSLSLPERYWDEEDFVNIFDQTHYALGQVENGPGPQEILIRDALSATEIALILNAALARGAILLTQTMAANSSTGVPLVELNHDAILAYDGQWITVRSGYEHERPRLSRACVDFLIANMLGGYPMYGVPEHRLPTLWEEVAVDNANVRGTGEGYYWRREFAATSMPLAAVLVRPVNPEAN